MSDYRVRVRGGEIWVSRWNPDKREREEKRKTEQVFSDVLQFPIEIEDTTFGQFFTLVAAEAELFDRVFRGATYGFPIKAYYDEMTSQPTEAAKKSELDYLEVYWQAEILGDDVEICTGFHGWGDWPKTEGVDDEPTKGGIAIEFTPLHEYKDHALELDTEFKFWDLDEREPIAEGEREFRVYNVIEAILHEITWGGDPAKRNRTAEDIAGGK